jgi:hypothetical protein
MRSKDDSLYASTVRRTPKSWWEKLLALDRKEDPRRRPAKRAIPKRSVWAIKGPEELS